MNKTLFDWYKDIKKNLAISLANNDEVQVKEYTQSLKVINESCPGMENDYLRFERMINSFTNEQKDFICYQIGEWYMTWKCRIVVDAGVQHRLGFAKEQLKTMICGD